MCVDVVKVTSLSEIVRAYFKVDRKLNILLLGAFGAQNLGDLAILRTIMNDIDHQNDWLNVSIASRDNLLRDSFGVNLINPFSFNGLWQLLAYDVFVIGGGGLYGHETHRYIRLILPVVFILKIIFRKKVIFYNTGIYRDESKLILQLLWFILELADVRILRDDSDIEIIPKRLMKKVRLEPDITVLLPATKPVGRDSMISMLEKSKCVVGLSLRFLNLKKMFSPGDLRLAEHVKNVIVNQFLREKIPVLFVPFQPADVMYVRYYFKDVVEKYPDHFKIAEMGRLKPEEIKWIVGRFRIAIGMRLHFQIFSHDQDTALIGIPYASKCRNFLKRVHAVTVDACKITEHDLVKALEQVSGRI